MTSRGWSGRRASQLRALTLATYGDLCHLCGWPGATTADHIIPRSLGGDDSLANLRPAHSTCNYSRGNMTVQQWREKYRATRSPPPKSSPRWS
ncbi:HNH endonuclease [Corynebacterium propinquum]|uniref:HNH endonuclease n=1 Tax=Corynebacterium propinquum TaxID=43769 RepID=UPI002542ED5A|nr:HNH endonuclease signature motif containing protein [Corynebacterium propinquum]MDK4252614.1 HNH endonuclease signature motif containing protein [Corynebacterium propinquum]WKS49449.1 HNH endonuclease [Corynebacterium propinquum]